MTEIDPFGAPAGTVVVILVELTTVKVAAVPLNLTEVVPVKLVPVRVTEVPARPEDGVKDEIVGAPAVDPLVTVNEAELVPVPPEFVTETLPVVVPVGTVAVIWVALTTVNDVAVFPLNFTAVTPTKLVPLIVTTVPIGPDVGVNELTVGTGTVTV